MSLTHSPQIVTNGLIYMLDPANPKVWNGTNSAMTDLIYRGSNVISGAPYSLNTTSYAVPVMDINNTSTLTTATSTASIALSTPDLNAIAVNQNFSIMFATHLTYLGYGGSSNGDSNLITGVPNGASLGWRVVNYNFGIPGGLPITGNNSFYFYLTSAAVSVQDTVSYNRMCIVAFTVSPTTILGWCNGNISSITNPQNYIPGTSNPTWGTQNAGVGSFNGQLGFLQIYNRALSLNEIQQNFEAMRGRYNL